MSDRSRPGDPAAFFDAHVFVCVNARPDGHARGCCKSKGSDGLRGYMKVRVKELGLDRVRVNQSMCLDRCEFGPTMVIYPEGVWYRPQSTDDVDEIIDRHLLNGERVARLMLGPADIVVQETGSPSRAAR